jgi:GlpG protein
LTSAVPVEFGRVAPIDVLHRDLVVWVRSQVVPATLRPGACGTRSRAITFAKDAPLRQIGTVPKSLDPKGFADYLLSLGMKTRIDDHPEGWAVWIYDEDHVEQARDALRSYLSHPDDPRYRDVARAAEMIRRNEQLLDKKFRKNYRDAADLWGYPSLDRRPLTTAIIVICVIVFVMQNLPRYQPLIARMHFSSYMRDARGNVHGLDEIKRGEVWRLVTPIFLHGNPLHIVFNLLAFQFFGTRIEVRRGTLRLAALVLVSAAISNYGQYLWMERMEDVAPFGGMSGVVYALFGYAWIKGIYQPEQGLGVHPSSVNIMLLWLVLCMTNVLGPIANGAHVVGLAVGIVFGLMGF